MSDKMKVYKSALNKLLKTTVMMSVMAAALWAVQIIYYIFQGSVPMLSLPILFTAIVISIWCYYLFVWAHPPKDFSKKKKRRKR